MYAICCEPVCPHRPLVAVQSASLKQRSKLPLIVNFTTSILSITCHLAFVLNLTNPLSQLHVKFTVSVCFGLKRKFTCLHSAILSILTGTLKSLRGGGL